MGLCATTRLVTACGLGGWCCSTNTSTLFRVNHPAPRIGRRSTLRTTDAQCARSVPCVPCCTCTYVLENRLYRAYVQRPRSSLPALPGDVIMLISMYLDDDDLTSLALVRSPRT